MREGLSGRGIWIDWSVDPEAETVRVARRFVGLVDAGRWREASRAVAGLIELDHTGRSPAGAEAAHAACVAVVDGPNGDDTPRPDVPLRAGYLIGLLRGWSAEWRLGVVEQLVAISNEIGGPPEHDPWPYETELYRVRTLWSLKRYAEVVEVATSLILSVSDDVSGELSWIEFDAGVARCQALVRLERLPEAAGACGAFRERWIGEVGLPLRQRKGLMAVMLNEGSAVQKIDRSDQLGEKQLARLGETLRDWLRHQPESPFRDELIRRLIQRFGRLAEPEQKLETLEEMVDVLETVEDRELTFEAAGVVLRDVGRLVEPGEVDVQPVRDVILESVRSDRLERPDEAGISPALFDRLERTFASLILLDSSLGRYADEHAEELRAAILFRAGALAELLGRVDDRERLAGQLIALGDAAVRACDRVVTESEALRSERTAARLQSGSGGAPDESSTIGSKRRR